MSLDHSSARIDQVPLLEKRESYSSDTVALELEDASGRVRACVALVDDVGGMSDRITKSTVKMLGFATSLPNGEERRSVALGWSVRHSPQTFEGTFRIVGDTAKYSVLLSKETADMLLGSAQQDML